jgi:hypothetical protein
MKSLLVEHLRFDPLGTGILQSGKYYLLVCGALECRQIATTLDFKRFIQLQRQLRYPTGPADPTRALAELAQHLAPLLEGVAEAIEQLRKTSGDAEVQLDLVLNAAELSGLPFEVAAGLGEFPLAIDPGRMTSLTRRVRGAFADHVQRWPAKPRILFAHASPPGVPAVPVEEHKQALRDALAPWIEPLEDFSEAAPDDRKVLTVLPAASLESIRAAIEAAAGSGHGPYTHIHILAHGVSIDEPPLQHFGLAFHAPQADEVRRVTASDLVAALSPATKHAIAVTLAACDSGSEVNCLIDDRSVAHELHTAGFPIVVASQFPLTVPGSVVMAREFYGALLDGIDVRSAVRRARQALYRNHPDAGHDWASLVAYVRLPEGYADQLEEARLEAQLAALRTAQRWTDHVVKNKIRKDATFERVEGALLNRIAALTRSAEEGYLASRPAILCENLGLLGSAEKRLAELLFFRAGAAGKASPHWDPMRRALQRSRAWYAKAYAMNLSHHWTGTQKLCLEAILDGKIADPREHAAALLAATIDSKKPDEPWAFGSIAELLLLAPAAGLPPRHQDALDAIATFKERVQHHENHRFALESTCRQLSRYVNWWINYNDFVPGAADLSQLAAELLEQLGCHGPDGTDE